MPPFGSSTRGTDTRIWTRRETQQRRNRHRQWERHEVTHLLDMLANTLARGGFVMPPLLLSAFMVWYAIGYRSLVLGNALRADLDSLVANPASEDPLDSTGSVIHRAIRLGLEVAQSRSAANINDRLNEVFYPFRLELKRFATLLSAFVAIAPLLGLLGTVSGMIATFDAPGNNSLMSQVGEGAAAGISEALFSTQFGLLVAIPGLVIGRWLDRRQQMVEDLLTQVECAITTRVALSAFGGGEP